MFNIIYQNKTNNIYNKNYDIKICPAKYIPPELEKHKRIEFYNKDYTFNTFKKALEERDIHIIYFKPLLNKIEYIAVFKYIGEKNTLALYSEQIAENKYINLMIF